MAYNHASAFFLIALIFFATANPLAHGQLMPGLPFPFPIPTPVIPGLLPNLTVNGILCCTPTGNCVPGSPPVAGALVNLTCPGLLGTVGQATTTTNGSYSISVNLSLNPLIPPQCTVRVGLPLNGTAATACSLLSNVQGALEGTVVLLIRLINQFLAAVSNLVVVSG